jgi:catechol 2,3-dioxygenase
MSGPMGTVREPRASGPCGSRIEDLSGYHLKPCDEEVQMTTETAQAERPATSSKYFQPRRIGHVNLWVEEIGQSERFYNSYCGLNVEFSEPDLVATFLGTGHTPHDLGMMQTTKGVDRYGRNGLLQLPGTIGLKPGLNHLAWELLNEKALVDAFRRLKADGIDTDMTVDHQVAHSVYIFDPEGNYNEYYCDTIKDWRSVLHGEMELITSNWDPATAEGFTDSRFDENPELRFVEGAFVHPQRLTHAVLLSKQPAALEKFYTTVGGLDVVSRQKVDGREVIYFASSLPTYTHNLVVISSDEARFGNSAFELKSEDKLQEAIAKLKANGIAIDRMVDLPWKSAFFLRDPDGLLSEYYVRRGAKIELAERGDVPLEYAV